MSSSSASSYPRTSTYLVDDTKCALSCLLNIEAKKVETVLAEITSFVGEAIKTIGVADDVAAGDFPKRIVDATCNQLFFF